MIDSNVRAMLSNLIKRIERNTETGQYRLEGVITEDEYAALLKALQGLPAPAALGSGVLDEVVELNLPADPEPGVALPGWAGPAMPPRPDSPSPHDPPPSPPPHESGAGGRQLVFDRRRHQAADNDVILCIDFGTARSKAFARRKSKPAEYDLELMLGEAAGYEGFDVPSMVWIDGTGRVFFGQEASIRSLDAPNGRAGYDSLKDSLTLGFLNNIHGRELDNEINPTGETLFEGDLISFYLGYLTWLAEKELTRLTVSPYVRRRFAIPCWSDSGRRQKGEDALRTYLARAQILADSFGDDWNDGIPVEQVRAAVRELQNRSSELPRDLIGEAVSEPVAAGPQGPATLDTSRRHLVMVEDCGAGTTDYALFLIAPQPQEVEPNAPKKLQICLLPHSLRALSQAGNIIDKLLVQEIMSIAPVANDKDYVLSDIRRKARQWKESLFRDEELTFRLVDDREGCFTLETFLNTSGVAKFKDQVQIKFRETLEAGLTQEGVQSFDELLVVLTGGGATLPMIKALGEGQVNVHGKALRRRWLDVIPEAASATLGQAYSTLAVAVGGAAPALPEEKTLTQFLGVARRL